MIEKLAYSPSEAAEAIGVCKRTIDSWIKEGRLKSVSLTPGCRRIPVKELEKLLEIK